jgi:hypothetical protein
MDIYCRLSVYRQDPLYGVFYDRKGASLFFNFWSFSYDISLSLSLIDVWCPGRIESLTGFHERFNPGFGPNKRKKITMGDDGIFIPISFPRYEVA